MERRFSVGIVGIPIEYNCYGCSFFKISLTDRLRLDTKESIQNRSQEVGLRVNVSDLGELIDFEYKSDKKVVDIPNSVFINLAQELKKLVTDFDFILVYGGVHSAAYVLYSLRGRVDRYDIHEDAAQHDEIHGGSYMWHAVYSPTRIKHPNQVTHHGKIELTNKYNYRTKTSEIKTGLPAENAHWDIFDIDVDFYMSTEGTADFELCADSLREERLRAEGIKQAIRNAKPKVIGIFEYQRLDRTKRGYKLILDFAWEGTVARFHR